MNIAVFCSGNGSNFQAIVDAGKAGLLKADITLMVSDNPEAFAIKRAEKEGIKTFIIERSNFSSREGFEARIIEELRKERIELICLAGYMRLMSAAFVREYKNRILNIHPAILPSFKGTHGIKDALDYGAKVTGVTVHFVNEDMDAGPIILQEAMRIEEDDTEDSLTQKIHSIEHRIYPEAIRLFTEKKLKTVGRKVKLLTAVIAFLTMLGLEPKVMSGREAIPVLAPEAKVVLAVGEQSRAAPKADLPVSYLLDYQRLGLSPQQLYNIEGASLSALDTAEALNPALDIERPLSKEEREKIKIEGSIKIAQDLAEAMDSMDMEFAGNGIQGLISATRKVVDLRNYIGNRYNLHLSVDDEEALLKYRKRF